MLKHVNILLMLFWLVGASMGQMDFDDLSINMHSRVQDSLKPLENLGARIEADVKRQLAGLENLGHNIQEKVDKDLEPVRAMESMMKIKYGMEGTTIATFSPGGRQLVIRNGRYYQCNGAINEYGDCSGILQKVQFQNKEDFCFVPDKNTVSDWYCIAPDSNFKTISSINGKVVCETQDDSPKLLIKISEFEDMCKNMATSINFKYLTNSPLRHVGNGLTCSESQPQVCSYSEALFNRGNRDNFQATINA